MWTGGLTETTPDRQNVCAVINEETSQPAEDQGNKKGYIHHRYYIPKVMPENACNAM
jgi:hypothetical protein